MNAIDSHAIDLLRARFPQRPSDWLEEKSKQVSAAIENAVAEAGSDWDPRLHDPIRCLSDVVYPKWDIEDGYGWIIRNIGGRITANTTLLNLLDDCALHEFEIVEDEINEVILIRDRGEVIGTAESNHKDYWGPCNVA